MFFLFTFDVLMSLSKIGNILMSSRIVPNIFVARLYEGWNFNSGNYLFTTDTK